MEKNLLKELLELVESFKNEISDVSKKREYFNLASNKTQASLRRE
ncbi:hypothetical protein [Thermovibrio sp.]